MIRVNSSAPDAPGSLEGQAFGRKLSGASRNLPAWFAIKCQRPPEFTSRSSKPSPLTSTTAPRRAKKFPGGGKAGRYSAATKLALPDRKSTRLNSSHSQISYAVFCLKKKKKRINARIADT